MRCENLGKYDDEDAMKASQQKSMNILSYTGKYMDCEGALKACHAKRKKFSTPSIYFQMVRMCE